jgi:YD repeat-containing protein
MTYTYDAANRLVSVTQGTDNYGFTYNGQGDRLSQTMNGVPRHYTLDLHAGLTQVLDDGPNTYLYGTGRLGELQPGGFVYHLGDALGSVRQMVQVDLREGCALGSMPFEFVSESIVCRSVRSSECILSDVSWVLLWHSWPDALRFERN